MAIGFFPALEPLRKKYGNTTSTPSTSTPSTSTPSTSTTGASTPNASTPPPKQKEKMC